jgi:hypothetical protein
MKRLVRCEICHVLKAEIGKWCTCIRSRGLRMKLIPHCGKLVLYDVDAEFNYSETPAAGW